MRFGAPATDPPPLYSIIVPLFGRIDFMEYQLALFAGGGMAGSELIYVLDDPPHRREVQTLAESLYLRFGLPFRLLLLSHNVGFAPANNIGLAHARGAFVGFVNSDVFPGTPDWMPRLAARLQAEPTLGAVGPLLLYEDGSVQHEGMVFQPIPALGDLRFPHHHRKGWRPRAITGLVREELITGACLVMRRDLARDLGGFDESYVIGDFEDTDLCLKLRERGLFCAIDHDVWLYHLERKSQPGTGQRWRMNLTLYNAWVHHCRWFAAAGPGGADA
jgi:GT2 family glycosyltransferase